MIDLARLKELYRAMAVISAGGDWSARPEQLRLFGIAAAKAFPALVAEIEGLRERERQLREERNEAYRHMTEARAGWADAVRGLTCEHHGLYRGETTGCCIHYRARAALPPAPVTPEREGKR